MTFLQLLELISERGEAVIKETAHEITTENKKIQIRNTFRRNMDTYMWETA
jgi:hypothetical protein